MLRPSQNAAALAFGNVIQKAVSVGYFILVARLVGAEGVGIFAFVVSLMLVFGAVVDLGLNGYVTREVVRTPDRIKELLSHAMSLKCFSAVIAFIGLMIFLHVGHFPEITRIMGTIVAVAMVTDGFMLLFYAALRGLQDFRYEARGMAMSQTIIAMVGTVGLLLHAPLQILAWAFLAGSCANAAYAVVRVRQFVGSWPVPGGKRAVWSVLFLSALPFFLSGIFTRVYGYLDNIFLTLFSGEAATGLYAAASKIPFALSFIPGAFSAGVYPRLSTLARDNRVLFGNLFERSVVAFGALALPMGFGLAFLSREIILLLYGPAFARSVIPLILAGIGFIFSFFGFLFTTTLNAADRQHRAMAHLGIATAVNVILNMLLIPLYKEIGAAIAGLATGVMIVFLGIIALRNEAGIQWKNLVIRISRLLLAAAGMALVVIALADTLHVVIVALIGALTYGALVLLLRGVSRQDIETAKRVIRQRI